MRRIKSKIVIALTLTVLLLLTACREESAPQEQARPKNEAPALTPTPTNENRNGSPGDTPPGDFEGTAGVVEKKRDGIAPVVLRDVRTARQEGFDRIVFEFEGGTLPGYHVEYVDKPVRQCGSGEAVPVAGDGWLRVRLSPSQAHTDSGSPTVKDRERRPDLTVLKELKVICDFEADVEWVLGLSSPNRYRVLELANPTRLVLDVKH